MAAPPPRAGGASRAPSGIADDAGEYADFPEGAEKARAKDDSELFGDLVAPAAESSLGLEASWLYKATGQIFGPISSKALLEKLYAGEIDGETAIAPEGGEFMALRRYGALELHLPKAAEHKKATEEARRREAEVTSKQRKRWALIAVSVVVALGGGGALVWKSVADARVAKAEREKREQEEKLKRELESLIANLTIEPPLVELVDEEEPEAPPKPGEKRRPRAKRPAARPGSDLPPTVPIQRSEVVAGVNEVFGGLKRCIVEQIQRDPESVGERIELSFVVNNAGQVRDFDINDRILRKLPLKDCMGATLATLKFRKYVGEVQTIEYPITIGGRRG